MLKIGKLQQIKDENKRFQDAKKYFECEKYILNDDNRVRNRNRSKSEYDYKNENDQNLELNSNNSRNKINLENENNFCRSLDSFNLKRRKTAKKVFKAPYLPPIVTYESESKNILYENIFIDENAQEGSVNLVDSYCESQIFLKTNKMNKIKKELFDKENPLPNILPKPISHHTKFNFQ